MLVDRLPSREEPASNKVEESAAQQCPGVILGVHATSAHLPRAPQWPTFMFGGCAVLATLSILQGFVDVVMPALRGEEPFGFLYQSTERFGPAFFIGYVFVHNLGLACVVPGFGFLAAWFERKTHNRAIIGGLLAGAVAMSLLVAAQYLITAHQRFDLALAIPLYAGEALSVLALALAASLELKGFVPTRRYEWALVTPFRRMALVLATTASLLVLLATLEAYTVLVLR